MHNLILFHFISEPSYTITQKESISQAAMAHTENLLKGQKDGKLKNKNILMENDEEDD